MWYRPSRVRRKGECTEGSWSRRFQEGSETPDHPGRVNEEGEDRLREEMIGGGFCRPLEATGEVTGKGVGVSVGAEEEAEEECEFDLGEGEGGGGVERGDDHLGEEDIMDG